MMKIILSDRNSLSLEVAMKNIAFDPEEYGVEFLLSTDVTEVITVYKGEEILWNVLWEKELVDAYPQNFRALVGTMSTPAVNRTFRIIMKTPYIEIPERYRHGEMSERARAVVRETAPYLNCKDGNDMKKVGASEYKRDEARLGEHAKKFLGAVQLATRQGCNAGNLALARLSEWEPDVSILVKMVARRTIVEDVLGDYNAKRKLKSYEEYVAAAMPEVAKAINYLIGKTEEIPRFRVRVFPESAPGRPVRVKGRLGTYLVDRFTGAVISSSKKDKWCVHMEHNDELGTHFMWYPEKIEGDVSDEVLRDITDIMYEKYPRGIRYIFS